MSKKMQDIVCIGLVAVVSCLIVFGFTYLALSFIAGTTELSEEARKSTVMITGMYIIFGAWWFSPLTGFYLSDAIEEKWKD